MSQPLRILWIEDDKFFTDAACLNFQNAAMRAGEQITIEAVRTLSAGVIRSDEFDCVILDLGLPDSRTEETLAAIPRLAEIMPPIIVLSGFTYPDEGPTGMYWQAILNGAEDVYFKPQIMENPHLILDAIKKVVLIRHRQKHAT